MEPSLALPDTSQIVDTARSAVDLLDETADAVGSAAASVVDTTSTAIDTAAALAGPTAAALAPTIGRFFWRQRKWVVAGLVAITVLVAIKRWRGEPSSEVVQELPSEGESSQRAAS